MRGRERAEIGSHALEEVRTPRSSILMMPKVPDKPEDRPLSHKYDFWIIPMPRQCRSNASALATEPKFSWKITLVFALASTVSVMNIYVSQPMLVDISNDLEISQNAVSLIPTLAQAGYALGVLLMMPLGDMVRRRPLLLFNFAICACLDVGLALSRNVAMLEAFSFLIAVVSITPEICIPWTADLAPSNIRAQASSITLAGLAFGLVIGRLLAGILATYASWRDTYWLGVALQATILGVLWLSLPDTPDKKVDVSYPRFVCSMFEYLYKYPTLLQASLCFCLLSAVYGGFWTCMTFVLSTSPYNYSPFKIGLFGLLGVVGALLAPQWGRLVDKIVPWTAQLLGFTVATAAMVIALGADKNLTCVCIPMIVYDVGIQIAQVATVYRIQGLEPAARSRMSGCFLLLMFVGQTIGTAVMTKVYVARGWLLTGVTAVVLGSFTLVLLVIRGPHETGWIGWRGGAQLFRHEKLTDLSPSALTEYGKKGKPQTQREQNAECMENLPSDWSRSEAATGERPVNASGHFKEES